MATTGALLSSPSTSRKRKNVNDDERLDIHKKGPRARKISNCFSNFTSPLQFDRFSLNFKRRLLSSAAFAAT